MIGSGSGANACGEQRAGTDSSVELSVATPARTRLRAALLLLVACAPAVASESTPLSSLIDSAVALSGYPRPQATLAEQLVSPEAMADLVCRGRHCPIYAAYLDQDVLYLRTDVGDVDLADHLRFHEVVHWLQHHSGKFPGTDCDTRVAREREAYRLENRFISEVQHGVALMVIPPYDCPPMKGTP